MQQKIAIQESIAFPPQKYTPHINTRTHSHTHTYKSKHAA